MPLTFANPDAGAIPVHVVEPGALSAWLADQDAATAAWVTTVGFTGKLGSSCLIPATDGGLSAVLFGYGTEQDRRRGRLHLAALPSTLPKGTYHLVGETPDTEELALAWLLAGYSFKRYRKGDDTGQGARLVAPDGVNAKRLEAIAAGTAQTQDLINTPANDMGPPALEEAARRLAAAHGASIEVTTGDDLLDAGFPLIHTVGRASVDAPRLIDIRWGKATDPTVTLVGKGVCFDTGGLNLKPGSSMGLMKKDMGGAATTIGLADMIMAQKLPVRLRLLIPAVENAVAGNAFRPGDILPSRKGLTVEINNTDAEGRLVLADALALGDEEKPDLMVSMATLTGAARVALGPDVPPFYTDDAALAGAISSSATRVADPLWQMPFWDPYEAMIEPGIADLDNAPSGGFAGSITAALFLRRFVEDAGSYAHFDIYGWTPAAKPARPKGGACQGARALFDLLERGFVSA